PLVALLVSAPARPYVAVAARRRLACIGTRGVVGVVGPVVARLAGPGLHEPVAAARRRAIARTRVGVDVVAVVARLRRRNHPVAAARERAIVRAVVVVDRVAVVAALARSDLAVAADVVRAIRRAALAVAVVRPVVGLLAGADFAVPALPPRLTI